MADQSYFTDDDVISALDKSYKLRNELASKAGKPDAMQDKNLEVGFGDVVATTVGSLLSSFGIAIKETGLGDMSRATRKVADGSFAKNVVDGAVSGITGKSSDELSKKGLLTDELGLDGVSFVGVDPSKNPVKEAASTFLNKAADTGEYVADKLDSYAVKPVAGVVGGGVKAAGDGIKDWMSDDAKEAAKSSVYTQDENGDFHLGNMWSDPARASIKLLDTIGTYGGVFAAGLLTSGTVKSMVTRTMLKRGASEEIAKQTAELAAKKWAERAVASSAMGVSVGGAADNARGEYNQLSDSEKLNSPTFIDTVKSVYEQHPELSSSQRMQIVDEQMRDKRASFVKSDPATYAAAAAGTMMGESMLFKMVTGKAGASEVTGGLLSRAAQGFVKGGFGEGVGEAIEEGVQRNVQNRASNAIDNTNIDPMQGVALTAAEAGTLGALTGGAIGSVSSVAHGSNKPAQTSDGAEQTGDFSPDLQSAAESSPEDAVNNSQPSDDLLNTPAYQRQGNISPELQAATQQVNAEQQQFKQALAAEENGVLAPIEKTVTGNPDEPAFLRTQQNNPTGRDTSTLQDANPYTDVQAALANGGTPTAEQLIQQSIQQGNQGKTPQEAGLTGDLLLAKQQPGVPATTEQSSGATVDGQTNEVIPESRGLGYSGTINMPGSPGNGINNSYVPPVTQSRQTADKSLDTESTRDPRSPVAQSIAQAGTESDSIFGQLKSLRVTKRGKPFASQKEALLASRKTETPIELPTGGFGVVDKAELEQAQAIQAPAATITNDGAKSKNIPDSILSAFPDMQVSNEGYLGLNSFTLSEREALKNAGLVQEVKSADGSSYLAVDPEKLWDLRKTRSEELKNTKTEISQEERNRAIENRASSYDQLANEQDELGDLGDKELAAKYRAKAEEVRQRKSTSQPIADQAVGTSSPETVTAPVVATDSQQTTTPSAGTMVEHKTGKGKVLRGVVRTDLTVDEAKAIDPYTFKKDGGYFIREQHLDKLSGVKAETSITAEPEAENDATFTPRDGWETNLQAAREYANHLRKTGKISEQDALKAWNSTESLAKLIKQIEVVQTPMVGHGDDAITLDQLKQLRIDTNQQEAGNRAVDDRLLRKKDQLDKAITEAEGTTEKQAAPKEQFADNKLFTADRVAAARARMKSKMGNLNSGLDPEMLVDGMTIAGAYIESGVRDFTAYAKSMTDDFGDGIKPFLLSFWGGARNYPGLDTKGMTKPEATLAAKEWLKQFKTDINVRVVKDQAEFEKALADLGQPDALQEGEVANAAYLPDSNTILINAAAIQNPSRLRQILRHEVLAHYGLEKVVGREAYQKVMRALQQGAGTSPAIQAAFDKVTENYQGANVDELLREVFAHYAENRPVDGGGVSRLWQRVVNLVKAALQKVGFIRQSEAETALDDVLNAIAENMRNGVTNVDPETTSKVQFSKQGKTADTSAADDELMTKLGLGPKQDVIDKTKERINTLKQADRAQVKSWIDETIKKANTQILDALAPIKYAEDAGGKVEASDSGYVAARLASGSASVMNATMLHGLPAWKDGVIQRKDGTGEADSLLGIFESLGPDLHNWLGWMAGHRGEILLAEGRENLLTPEDISALKAKGNGKEAKFDAARQKWNALNKAVLDLAEEAGLFTTEDRAAWDSEWYVPFFRETEDGDVTGPYKHKGIANQTAGIKKLKGGTANVNDILQNIFTTTSKTIDAAMKNMAAQKVIHNLAETDLIEVITKPNLMDIKAAVKNQNDMMIVKLEGEDYLIRVNDKNLFNAMTMIDQKVERGAIRRLAMRAKHILTVGVTASPDFMLRNFLRDAASSWAINEDGFKPMIDSIRGMKKAWKMDDSSINLMFSGASFMSGNLRGNDPEVMASAVRKALRRKGMSPEQVDRYEKTIIRNGKQAMDAIGKYWEKYARVGEAVENGSREAVYEAAIKAGKTHAQAAFEAKDLMDFSMMGSSKLMQVFVDVLPFFNARMQGLGKLGRAIKANPKQIAKRGGMIAGASLALLALNWDDERYEDLPDWDKDLNWHFWLGDQHFRIPKPFEIGLMFGTLPERMARTMGGKDTAGKFGKVVARNMLETFAINPIPQVVKPLTEAYFNYDPFRGGPIESMSDMNVNPEARYDERTSLMMRELGELTGMSPKKLEHVISGYTGTMGGYVMAMGDGLVRMMGDYGDSPALRADQIPLLKSVYQGSAPAKSTQAMQDFYQMVDEANQVYATIRQYNKEGRTEDANELLEENRGKLAGRKTLNKAQLQFRSLRNEMSLIQRDKLLNSEQKRDRLDKLLKRRNDFAAQLIQRFE